MQTAQLTFNGRIVTEFFGVLFLFQCCEKTETGRNICNPYLLGSFFSLFFGLFGVKNGQHSWSALYCAKNIRDQLFVWVFFCIINGRHRMTVLNQFSRSIGPQYNGAAVYIIVFYIRHVKYFIRCLIFSLYKICYKFIRYLIFFTYQISHLLNKLFAFVLLAKMMTFRLTWDIVWRNFFTSH